MGTIKDRLISMLYPVYGFKLNEEDEDTKCKDLRRRDLTEAFVGQTSAHGPPHIYGARGLIKKTIWFCVTVTALVWMFIQLRSIFEEYIANKVTVSVDIRAARQVNFPSITVCNLNAIRNSYLPSEFQAKFTAIEEFDQERVEQRAEEELVQQMLQQADPNQQQDYGGEDYAEEPPDPADPPPSDSSGEGGYDYRDNYDYTYGDYGPPEEPPDPYADPDYYTGTGPDPYADPYADSYADPPTDTAGSGSGLPPDTVRRKRETDVIRKQKIRITSPKLMRTERIKRQVDEEEPPPPPESDYSGTGSDYEYRNTEDEPRYSDDEPPEEPPSEQEVDPSEAQQTFDGGDEQQEEEEEEETFVFYDPYGESNEESGNIGGDKDAADIKKESIFEDLTTYPTDVKSLWGHQRDDFIVDCTYDGYECTMDKMFTQYYNWRYGNCFAFNAAVELNTSLPSFQTGPLFGLKMTFNIEQDEYVADLSEKAGVRVLIHSIGEMPFPEDKGIDIAPGRLTSVGIRKLIVSRKGGKYGDCVDTTSQRNTSRNIFEDLYTWSNYSFQACQKTCYQRYIIRECGCFNSRYPFLGEAVGNTDTELTACSSFDAKQSECTFAVDELYRLGELPCTECHLPCNETSYSTTVSQAAWPSLAYKETLLQAFSDQSETLKALLDKGGTTFEDNFAKLSIYYEELNLEEIIESPAYPLASLMADLGGTLGLWIGLSILSLFEMVEFFLDNLVLTSMHLCRWSSDKPDKGHRSSNISVQPLSEEDLGKPSKPPTREEIYGKPAKPDFEV